MCETITVVVSFEAMQCMLGWRRKAINLASEKSVDQKNKGGSLKKRCIDVQIQSNSSIIFCNEQPIFKKNLLAMMIHSCLSMQKQP